jgi:hypothetical protein
MKNVERENFCRNSTGLRPALLTILPLQFFNFLTGWLDIFSTLAVGNKPVPYLRQGQSCGSGIIYSGSGFYLSNHSGSGSYVSNHSGFGSYLSNQYGSDQAAKVQIFKSDRTRIRILTLKSFRVSNPDRIRPDSSGSNPHHSDSTVRFVGSSIVATVVQLSTGPIS